MYRLPLIFLLAILPHLIFAQSLENYFFPTKKLQKTKVYQFEVAKKPELTQYWKMKAVEKKGKWEMTTHTFNADFQLTEVAVEWIDSTGSELQYYVQVGKEGEMDTVDLVENKVFDWNHKEGEMIRWSMLINNEKNETLFFAKQRTLTKGCNKPTLRGRSYDMVCFNDALHSVNSDTYEELFSFTQTSYYANRMGLIGFDRFFEGEEEQNASYRLVKIWKEKKWNKLASK
ncbi:MAG: hypothetical protein AB8B69_17090 [Chitinophagales bacterium]